MLTLDYSKERLSDVSLGVGCDRDQFTTDPFTYGFLCKNADPFVSMMADEKFSLPCPSHTVWKVFGLSGTDVVQRHVFSTKPSTSKYRNAGRYDSDTYGSVFGGIIGDLGVLSGVSKSPALIPGNWTFTRHGCMIGRARPIYASFFDSEGSINYGSLVVDHVPYSTGGLSYSAAYDGVKPTLVRSPGFCPYDLSAVLPVLQADGVTFVYINGFGRYDGTLSGFTYSHDIHGWTFAYHLNWVFQGSTNVDLDVNVSIPYPSEFDSRTTPSLLYSLSLPSGSATYSWSNGHNTPSPNGSDPSGSVTLGPMNFVITSASTRNIPDEQVAFQSIDLLDRSHWQQRFSAEVERYHQDITNAAFLSTSSAMAALTDEVFTPPARSLSAAFSIAKQISLASIVEFPSSFLELPFKDFKRLVQLAPFKSPLLSGRALQLVHDLQVFSDLLSDYDKISHYRVHGSYNYDFPTGSFGRETSSLTCKTVLDVSASTHLLASALLTAETASFLASAATRLAQMPLLTLVNGMVGMTSELSSIFEILAGLTLPIVYCHAFHIRSPLSGDELEHLGISSLDGKPIELSWFFRDISLLSPLPRSGHFDFGPSTNPLGSAVSFAVRSLVLRILG